MDKRQLAYRASAFCARVYIPDALLGCSVEGEAEDISKEKEIPEIPDIFGEKEKEAQA